MDQREYFIITTGREVYEAYVKAIHQGATIADLEEVSRAALAKAYRVMAKVGVEN